MEEFARADKGYLKSKVAEDEEAQGLSRKRND
jgi:hypothetical protein